ncbi:MAG: MarR family transcriptional regulator [Nitrospiraceae bacterium]|nr:MarR family transcriptional regulator [Nitrospiraceae bacterium]
MGLSEELSLDAPILDLRHEAILNIVHTSNMIAAAGTPLFRHYDLTGAQFNLLFALKFKKAKVTQSELGKRLVVTRASVTSLVDKLEQKGLVERCSVPGNRRIYHIELTQEGQRLIDEVEPLYRSKVHQSIADLSEEECRTLIDLMERVRARTTILASQA